MTHTVTLNLTPVRMDTDLNIERQGDVLIVNSSAIDLSQIDAFDPMDPPPDVHEMIVGPILPTNDGYEMTVLLPYGADRTATPPSARRVALADGEALTINPAGL
ncbi:hypothetical protein [Pseudooctadecabacter jejudonensis]|uniref:Uncharacterized protein n=1 Tax=Pseudooctadecabacter jejudonensis TaxID=1391910 RepID=A0A1Y5TJP9_9RHOB|nr:hypothetical protein [Pseudooctadecabacter jejudonensis]SLN62025.1 hypothetical protein PSJ8397_03289 [Pseudooctadecabacter jejudonensis]